MYLLDYIIYTNKTALTTELNDQYTGVFLLLLQYVDFRIVYCLRIERNSWTKPTSPLTHTFINIKINTHTYTLCLTDQCIDLDVQRNDNLIGLLLTFIRNCLPWKEIYYQQKYVYILSVLHCTTYGLVWPTLLCSF